MVKLWSDLLSQILSTWLIFKKKAHNLFDSHVKKKLPYTFFIVP